MGRNQRWGQTIRNCLTKGEKLTVAEAEVGGGRGNQMIGIKESMWCDKYWVLYASDELLISTSEDVLVCWLIEFKFFKILYSYFIVWIFIIDLSNFMHLLFMYIILNFCFIYFENIFPSLFKTHRKKVLLCHFCVDVYILYCIYLGCL